MTEQSLLRQQMGQQASARQTAAANPLKSVWVGASAGTGKTKVLIDRVLRLMLPRAGMPADSATRPDKILCLTFTKTAAAEMSNRIYRDLAKWAVMPDAELQEKLLQLMGAKPDAETLHAARRLFARVLDTPGGLKIMTIHSFCQSVLKRFPVEAGLPPHFQLMDEQSAVEYLKRSEHDIIAAAKRDPSSPMAQAFSRLVLHLDPEAMSDLMAKITAKRSHLARILKNHGDAEGTAQNTIAAVYTYLGLEAGEKEADILTAAGRVPEGDEKNLRQALAALLNGSKTDLEKAARLQPWLEQPAHRAQHFHSYCRAFFTGSGEPYAKVATKAVEAAYPDITSVMTREATRLAAINDRLRSVRLANLNAALLTVAADMVGRYERYKRQTDQLDFEDLILKTCDLLAEKDMVNWVLFKLDEGIDHILVDEAQDTSPHQWRVIQSLALEFFSGMGAREDSVRTLFVVGDEKQSIFSFQGADPRRFSEMQDFFGAKVRDVQEGWEILLEHSFRSTRAVLDVVDAVFADVEARRGVVGHIEREVKHVAYREGQAGLVELWPLVQPTTLDPGEAWQMPVDIEPGENAASRLARKIAQTIQGWRVNGDILPSKNRPIRAGDVLILVQSRGAIVELLMRALKKEGVPVAGIDRMTLTEEIAIMDLLALARFALQPRDDLTLATVLKCPLIGMDEETLFTLCHGREGMLWRNLQTHKPDMARYLSGWIERAGFATPYEFFAGILNMPCHADHLSGRRAFYGRLSEDIHDALDEFLNAALHYEQSHTPSLQKFTEWFLQGEAQIKREQEQHKADQVRIMTVHASKGLQAPIVFLPDTAKKLHDHNKGRIRLLWPEEGEEDDGGVPLWSPREEFDAGIYAEKRDAAREGQEQEYRRLLYVALTRAEDRLYICGYKNRKAPPEDCWHSLVSKTFPAGGGTEEFVIDGAVMRDENNTAFMTRRHGYAQQAAPEKSEQHKVVDDALRAPLPEWALQPPAPEPLPPVPLAPSRPGEDEPASKSPLADEQDWRFRRGIVVHQILEVLPQLPPAEWDAALAAYLARPALEMPAAARASLAKEILAVLRHPQFAPIFGPGSRAETPIVGLAGRNRALSGQMDRLLVTETEVLIVDYKTNRPPPKVAEDVAPLYLKQMAAYRDVIHNIYPGRKVSCALLWTDGPVLMPLSENLLDPYAP